MLDFAPSPYLAYFLKGFRIAGYEKYESNFLGVRFASLPDTVTGAGVEPVGKESEMKPTLAQNKKGQGLTEYLIVLALIGIFSIGVVTAFGDTIKEIFEGSEGTIQSTVLPSVGGSGSGGASPIGNGG
ncbi:hypothetical protein JYT83_01570 [bacterium AH-315-F18]|nr:hypothetical protein [bacterium AH-315-F18]